MNEEEIIKIFKDTISLFNSDTHCVAHSDDERVKAMESLLDLYNKEKEQNNCLINEKKIYKELTKQAQEDVKIWRDIYNKEKEKNKQMQEAIKYDFENYTKNYISKDKIRDKIKEYIQDGMWKYQNAIDFILEELLEENKSNENNI